MSVHVSSFVWKHSEHKGTALLVMLALAEQANDDGIAWPGVGSIARRARCTERNVQILIRKLEEDEELEVRYSVGRKNTNVYGIKRYRDDLIEKGEKISPLTPRQPKKVKSSAEKGEIQRQEKVKPVSPEPKEEPREEPSYSDPPTNIYSKVVEDCLSLLAELEGYPKDKKKNAEHLAKLCTRHPSLNIRKQVQRFCYHYEEQGFANGQKPRARLSTWIANAEDWAADASTTSSASASPDCVINALAAYNREGATDLRKFAPLARKWDFTSNEEVPWEILRELSPDAGERARYLERIRSVATRAMRSVG